MTDQQYLGEIAKLQAAFSEQCTGNSVGVVVPAAMNIVLSAIMAIEDKAEAMKATESLRPMIDYIESQLQGVH